MQIEKPRFADDAELMRRVANGCPEAKETLVQRVALRVRTTVRYLSRGDQEADDLFQEAVLEIIKAAPTYQARGSIDAWVDAVTTHCVRGRLKRYWRRRRTVVLRSDDLGVTAENPEQDLLLKRQSTRVAELMARIKPKRRLALVLKLVHGYSVREIAEMTDTPVNTVRDRLKKGRAQLRKAVLRDDTLGEILTRSRK